MAFEVPSVLEIFEIRLKHHNGSGRSGLIIPDESCGLENNVSNVGYVTLFQEVRVRVLRVPIFCATLILVGPEDLRPGRAPPQRRRLRQVGGRRGRRRQKVHAQSYDVT